MKLTLRSAGTWQARESFALEKFSLAQNLGFCCMLVCSERRKNTPHIQTIAHWSLNTNIGTEICVPQSQISKNVQVTREMHCMQDIASGKKFLWILHLRLTQNCKIHHDLETSAGASNKNTTKSDVLPENFVNTTPTHKWVSRTCCQGHFSQFHMHLAHFFTPHFFGAFWQVCLCQLAS